MKKLVTAENFWEMGKIFACDRTFFGNSNYKKKPKIFACDRGMRGEQFAKNQPGHGSAPFKLRNTILICP